MKLLLDAMCGGIDAHLRMCGHDVVYALDRDVETDRALLALATAEDRTIVTRDRDLATQASDAILLCAHTTAAQLQELADAGVSLTLVETPDHCGVCNGPLADVPPESTVPEHVPAPVEQQVWVCLDCGQYFWKGSHWDRVRKQLDAIDTDTTG